MKNTESLFFSQAINACLSVAKSLGASDATAYKLAVNATTETFCQTKHNPITETPIFSDVVYRIICDEGLKGATVRFIFRKIRCLRDSTSNEKESSFVLYGSNNVTGQVMNENKTDADTITPEIKNEPLDNTQKEHDLLKQLLNKF